MIRKAPIGLAIAFGSVLLLGLSSYHLPPRFNKSLHTETGRVLAAEALKLLKPGGKVTIIARDTEAFPQPAMDLAVASLRGEFKRAGKEVRSVEQIQLDPIRPSEVPSGDYYELLRRLPAGDVIVSFLGPPVLLPEHLHNLGRPRSKVVALCTGSLVESSSIDTLLSSGLLHAAITNRPDAGGTRFEQLYAVVRGTPE